MDFGSEVEDDEGYLDEQKGEDEEKKETDSYEDSELEEERDFEDDQIKSGEFGNDNQELPEEKEESIWDDIDWSEDVHGKREKTIWDDIDWSEDMHGEREKTIWDDIDWSEDVHGKGKKNEETKNDDQNEEYNKEDYVENVESQSTSTVLTNKLEEIDSKAEHQEQEEQIEIRPEEYQEDKESIVNADEIKFIKDIEELAEHAQEIKAEDENVEPQAEKENAAYYAEQYYETLKEKETVNDEDSKEGQETEELRQEVAEELKGDQESDHISAELEEEEIIEVSEEITSTEEFEYLWEIRDKLDQEGKTSEEIEDVMHEAEEMYETLKNAEKIYEELQQENSKRVDHEDEASEEDLKEDLDRVDLIEQAVELEEKLVQQGESQEQIDLRVEESIETTKLEERLETIIEQQELEKLKLVDHEDEASEEDLKEELDRVDLVEQAVEIEHDMIQQGESQEQIDLKVEESIEATKFEERSEKIIEKEQNELKPELDAIEIESEDKKDLLEENTKLGSEESDEEETERLQELYRQETGRRPIYARKKTNGYSQWLEQREVGAEKVKNSKSESEKIKEIKEEDWKTILKQWIKEASEEECDAELKSELKKALESYNEFEALTRKFMELFEKSQHEKLSEKEKNILKSLTEKLQKLDPIKLELSASVFFIKNYITEQYWWDFWNKPLVNRVLSKFFKHISQKYKELRKEQKNGKINENRIKKSFLESEDFKYVNQDINQNEKQISMTQEKATFFKSNDSTQSISIANSPPEVIRNEILYSIENHHKSLTNNPIYSKFSYMDLEKKTISIYDDILNLINDDKNKAHKSLYNSLNGTKKPPYMAASLIYYLLAMNYLSEDNKKQFSKLYYCKALEIAYSSFTKIFNSLYQYFQKLPDYRPIEYLFSIQRVSSNDFILLVKKYIIGFIRILNNSKRFNHSLGLKDKRALIRTFNDILDSINKDNKKALNFFFGSLNKISNKNYYLKNPKYISASIIYYYLAKEGYFCDFLHDNSKNNFFTQAFLEVEFGFPKDSITNIFVPIYNFLKNIHDYGAVYGLIDNDAYTFQEYKLFIQEDLKKLRNDIDLPEEVWNEVIIMFNSINKTFSFNQLFEKMKENRTRNPRYLSISLLYYCLIKCDQKISQNELAVIFNISRTNIATISSVVQGFLQRIDKYKYIQEHLYSNRLSKEDFRQLTSNHLLLLIKHLSEHDNFKIRSGSEIVNKIENLLDNIFNYKDFNQFFNKDLYRKSKKPIYFASVSFLIFLRYYNSINVRISNYIKILNKNDNFNINITSFRVIYNALIKRFFEKEEKQYLNRNAVRKKFYDYNKIEEFIFLEERLENYVDSYLEKKLKNHFNNIIKGNLPEKFFKITSDTSRPSNLYLQGTRGLQLYLKKAPNITRSEINIFDLLIKNGAFKTYNSTFILCKYAREILNSHPLGLGNKRHQIILNEILLNYKNAIAIEIPIWKFDSLSNDYMIGHIDLLYLKNNCLYIADFKPTKEEIFRSIPQVAAYGMMILDNLKIQHNDVRCISFNHEIAIEFSPIVLRNEVLKCVQKLNKIMRSKNLPPLKTKNKILDFYEELKKF